MSDLIGLVIKNTNFARGKTSTTQLYDRVNTFKGIGVDWIDTKYVCGHAFSFGGILYTTRNFASLVKKATSKAFVPIACREERIYMAQSEFKVGLLENQPSFNEKKKQ